MIWILKKNGKQVSNWAVVMHALKPSTQEAEASYISEFKASLVYRTNFSVSKHNKTEQNFFYKLLGT